MRRLAVGVVAVLVFAGCSGNGDDEAQETRAAGSDTTEAPAAGDADVDAEEDATGDADESSPTDATDASTTTTTGPGQGSATGGGATSGAAAADDAPAPAQPGRYDYDVDGTTTFKTSTQEQSRPLPDTATLMLDAPDGERQRSVRESKDDDGNGSVTETVLLYQGDGVHLAYLKLSSSTGGIENTQEFRPSPPPLLIPAGASAGDHTEFTMKSTDGRLTVDTEVDVRGTETVSVAGTSVDALVIDIVSTFSGDFEGTQHSTSWIDRERSLTVKEQGETNARVGLNEVHSEHESVIRRLDPQ